MDFDIIIRNGNIVAGEKTYISDIGIKGYIIETIGNLTDKDATKIIDARGKYILPGIIEGHMHVEAPMGGIVSADDYHTQSISAAFGGVTTFMDFTNTNKGDSLLETLEMRKKEMAKSAIDFAVHGRIVEATDEILNEIKEFKDAGCPSFKMYTTYKEDGFMIEEADMLKVFEAAKEAEALTMTHCESDILCEYYEGKAAERNDKSWKAHSFTRPIICEVDSAHRIMDFARAVGNALLIVHTTTGEILSMAYDAQRAGYPIYIETCPHYLTIFDDFYDREDGHLAICSPPLRTQKEATELWEGMCKGIITVIGSDDCSFTREDKESYLERDSRGTIIPDYKKVMSGSSGIEARLSILLTEGVNKGRITLNQLVDFTATNPARLYGMYPKKGVIREGSDGDLIIVDLQKEHTITADTLHNSVGYTPFEGYKCKGRADVTISKGKVIVEDGKFLGKKGDGEFIRRKIDKSMLDSYFGGKK